MEAGSQPASPRTPSPAPELLEPERRLDPPSLESDVFQDLRIVLKALGCPEGFIDSILRCELNLLIRLSGKSTSAWCLEDLRVPASLGLS